MRRAGLTQVLGTAAILTFAASCRTPGPDSAVSAVGPNGNAFPVDLTRIDSVAQFEQVARATAAATVLHHATTYYFCAPRCADRFEGAPEKYLDATTPPEVMVSDPDGAPADASPLSRIDAVMLQERVLGPLLFAAILAAFTRAGYHEPNAMNACFLLNSLSASLPAGDPDFASLTILGGEGASFRTVGFTSLRPKGNGTFSVESSLDFGYRLSFAGKAGGPRTDRRHHRHARSRRRR